jgi:hypothetical protein
MSDYEMTDEDQMFFANLLLIHGSQVMDKVTKAKKDYGGHLWQKDPSYLAENALEEMLDGYIWLFPMIHIMKELMKDPYVQEKVKEIQDGWFER